MTRDEAKRLDVLINEAIKAQREQDAKAEAFKRHVTQENATAMMDAVRKRLEAHQAIDDFARALINERSKRP